MGRAFVRGRTRANWFAFLQRAVEEYPATAPEHLSADAQRIGSLLASLEKLNAREVVAGGLDMLRVDGSDPLFGQPIAEVVGMARAISALDSAHRVRINKLVLTAASTLAHLRTYVQKATPVHIGLDEAGLLLAELGRCEVALNARCVELDRQMSGKAAGAQKEAA